MSSVDDAAESRGTNPFVCNICQKTYGRIDHLARHFRSHTNEKPFRCTECSKTFARADLLKRHTTLHTATEQSGKKRKIRASQACVACAVIKVKCDQTKPCKRCVSKSLECRVDSAAPSSVASQPDCDPVRTDRWGNPPGSGSYGQNVPGPNRTPTPLHEQPLASNSTTNISLAEDPSLTGFLRDVLHPSHSTNPAYIPHSSLSWNQHHAPRDLMDFGQDLSLEFNDLDAVLTGDWGLNWLDPALVSGVIDQPTIRSTSSANTPTIDESINLSTAAYNRSAWRWDPNHERVNHDHALASVLVDSHGPDKLPRPRQQPLTQPLNQQDRDRIVALLLAGCERANYQKIVGLFPAGRVLDIFLNDFLLVMEHSIDSWFHIPTFSAHETTPELLTLMIAGGAILSRSSHAQKFGYALQEKGRLAISEMFESDGRNTRSLQALQAFAISLNIGTWSGDKRTMELAEANALPLITMLRRSGAFRRARGEPAAAPLTHDSPAALDQKWRAWVSGESSKRLAYHIFLHCVQVSAAFQTPPLVSYAEITLDLPAPQAVWRATSATEWRDQYFALRLGGPQLPSFVSSMRDAQTMGMVRGRIDLELTLYLVLLSHWCLAREYTQLSSANKAQATGDGQWAGTLLASSKRQELQRLLDSFYVAIVEWDVFVPKEVHMTSQLLRMNLCVAFEDLQLLAGREGEDEARRVFPSLKQWYRSPECRQAMWHAGQILLAARRPAGRSPNASRAATPDTPWLRDFHAVALYHAGLAFWVYGLLTKAIYLEHQRGEGHPMELPVDYQGEILHLDGDEGDEQTALGRDRFIGLNKGRAVISSISPFGRGAAANAIGAIGNFRPSAKDERDGPGASPQQFVVALDEPQRVMEVMVDALATVSQPPESGNRPYNPHVAGPQRPAMVENLIQLMRDLGAAASAV